MLEHMSAHMDIFMCPACGGSLRIDNDVIRCLKCHHDYNIDSGIPSLFLPNEWDAPKNDIIDIMKSFYENNPFPNYGEIGNVNQLIEIAQRRMFIRLLNEQIPFNTKILDVGCGTGQTSNFLSIAHRFVFGTDMCINSLKLAQEFKIKNNLERVGFYQMNLFKPIFREESFHLVICNGVLHHTSDPFWGFRSISKLVKKNGYILIGLYNKFGRFATDIRRFIFKISSSRFKFLDPRLRDKHIDDVKKHIWFMDQYKNPYQSKHTIREVLKWFDQTGFEFINGIPKLEAFNIFSEQESLFKKNPRGNWLEHLIVQTELLFGGSKEGGVFIMIGRRKA